MIWLLNGNEAGGDLVLIQTSLLLLCKSSCSYANELAFEWKSREIAGSKARSTPASLAFNGQVTEYTTVKWPIGLVLVVRNSTENRSNTQFDHAMCCKLFKQIENAVIK